MVPLSLGLQNIAGPAARQAADHHAVFRCVPHIQEILHIGDSQIRVGVQRLLLLRLYARFFRRILGGQRAGSVSRDP